MREIKFRGKNDLDGWVYGDYIRTTSKYKKENIFHYIISSFFEQFEIHEESLGQYTGLSDQANTEIYIGDIVALSGPYAKFEVIINPFTQIPVIDSEQGMENLYSVHKDVVVIGNIYENPELLEVNE